MTGKSKLVSLGNAPPKEKAPNWVEICTLGIAVIGAVAAFIRFSALDRQLAVLESKLKQAEVQYISEGAVQLTGDLIEPSDGNVGLHTLSVKMTNIRRATVNLRKIEFTIQKLRVNKDVLTMLSATSKSNEFGVLTPSIVEKLTLGASTPIVHDRGAGIVDRSQRSGVVHLLTVNDGELVAEQVLESATCIHTEISNHQILAGQTRQVMFDFVIGPQPLPQVLLLRVDCYLGDDTTVGWQTWMPVGFTSRRNSPLDQTHHPK